ncbi:hypothetical protein RsTz2092_02430 [Deferribacterales bacterium RsTz2092]
MHDKLIGVLVRGNVMPINTLSDSNYEKSYLSSHPEAKKWLENFYTEDRYALSIMLDCLLFVSYERFRDGIETKLCQIFDERKTNKTIKSRIGLYTIKHPNDNKNIYGSEDSLGNILKGICKKYSKKFYLEPTKEHLKACGIKNVIFVDDIIASGTRTHNFIKQPKLEILRSLRSLESLKKIEIAFLAYVVYNKGEECIKRNYPHRTIYKCLEQPFFPEDLKEELKEILKKYKANSGYKETFASVIFYNSIPNNVPSILWKPVGKIPSLFGSPNDKIIRDISDDLQHRSRLNEILWHNKQYKKALKLCESLREKKDMNLVYVATLLLRGVKAESLHKRMNLTKEQTKQYLDKLYKVGFIDDRHKLTVQGKFWLDKCIYRKTKINVDKNDIMYYPVTYRGIKL